MFLRLLKWLIFAVLGFLALAHFLSTFHYARMLGRSVPRADLDALESLGTPLGLLIGAWLGLRLRSFLRRDREEG